jgi:hypothetical protein
MDVKLGFSRYRKNVEVTQSWRKLHCEELNDFTVTSYCQSVGLRPLAYLLGLRDRIHSSAWICLLQMLCVVRQRSLWLADPSFRVVLPSVISKPRQCGGLGRSIAVELQKKTKLLLKCSFKADKIARVCGTYGRERNAYRFVVGKPEGKRLRGRPRIDGRIRLNGC